MEFTVDPHEKCIGRMIRLMHLKSKQLLYIFINHSFTLCRKFARLCPSSMTGHKSTFTTHDFKDMPHMLNIPTVNVILTEFDEMSPYLHVILSLGN